MMDTNRDFVVSMTETLAYLKQRAPADLFTDDIPMKEIFEADVNSDGVIQPEEMDPDLTEDLLIPIYFDEK